MSKEEEMINIPEVEEESTESKLFGKIAERDQMQRMIEENIRKIAEGDDVEGRTKLKLYLELEVSKRNKEIEELQAQL